MNFLDQLIDNTPDMTGIVDSLSSWPGLSLQEFIVTEGEFNGVLVGDQSVVKVPKAHSGEPRRTALFESYIVAALQDAKEPAPLAVPKLIESNTYEPPFYTVLSRVPGEILDPEAIRGFTKQEQRMLGRQVGTFVGWLGGR